MEIEYPLGKNTGEIECTLKSDERAYICALMIEGSLAQCRGYVRGRVLDVGCGRKPYKETYFSAAEEYVGMDYLTDRSQPDVVGSATDIPLPDESFDTVVCTEVLEHVPDPQKALREMARVLKPGGAIILTTPFYWPAHEIPYDYFRYPYHGLMYFFKEAGFTVERVFNRGRAYAYLGQLIQHICPHIIQFKIVTLFLNWLFLFLDRIRKNDVVTLGWTVVARK